MPGKHATGELEKSMSKPLTHHDADTTLKAINATLRRAEDLHWTDPAFLEWERSRFSGHVRRVAVRSSFGDLFVHTRHDPAADAYDRDDGHHIRPMIQELPDVTNSRTMTITADDYPVEITMSGPLMLGPEPDKVTATATVTYDVFAYLFRRPAATEQGLAAFAMDRQDDGWFGVGSVFSWDPDPELVAAMAEVVDSSLSRMAASFEAAAHAFADLAPLMPDPDDPREHALAHRRATRPWHTYTAGPQNRRRGNH